MAFKVVIFFGLMALALGFTIPEDQSYAFGEWEPVEEKLLKDKEIILRITRSPQERLEGSYGYGTHSGSSATINYVHPINRNLEFYGGASRNFRFNDNSGHVGLRYNF